MNTLKNSFRRYAICFFLAISCFVPKMGLGQFTVIHHFPGTSDGGLYPKGSLISQGNYLYGMTPQGGLQHNGVVFRMMKDGSNVQVLHDFSPSNGSNGEAPYGSLVFHGASLYGMTEWGGANSYGVIFKINPDGSGFSKLHDFDSTARYPVGALIAEGAYLYGMTPYGGPNGYGTIFRIMPDGTGFSVIHHFDDVNGKFPLGDLISDGTYLYGMTFRGGGVDKYGTLFRLMPDGTGFTKLLAFDDQFTTGILPEGSLVSDGLVFYGMTTDGGAHNEGTIFKCNKNGTGFQTIYDFTGGLDGHGPAGKVLLNGTEIYGMASGGAGSLGNIFKVNVDGSGFANVLFFDSLSGTHPAGSLIADSSYLYGMTNWGEGISQGGTVFKLGYTPVAIAEPSKELFSLSPNPSSGQFTVAVPKATGTLNVFNMNGVNVFQSDIRQPKFDIDLRHEPKGIYCVRIQSRLGVATKKIVVE